MSYVSPKANSPTPIYLDHHATTPLDPTVLEAMMPYLTGPPANAGSISHCYGERAAAAIAAARGQVARLLVARDEQNNSGREEVDSIASGIVFTSGATEANNLALKGLLGAASRGRHAVISAAEHKSVIDPARSLARQGHAVTVLPVDNSARVSVEQVAAAIRPETALVSVIFASNEVGSINDIFAIGTACRERGVPFHTDAVQALAACPLDLARAPIDLVSLSAHKLYGPQGIGALFVRRGGDGPAIRLAPQMEGGGQERRLRSGTLPTALIVGFGKACELALERMAFDSQRVTNLRDRLWELLRARLDGVLLNGGAEGRLPGNLNFRIEGVRSEALLAKLRRSVAASSGAACSSADPVPSHVLAAMGLSNDQIAATIRFGIGRFTTTEDVNAAAEAIVAAARELRE